MGVRDIIVKRLFGAALKAMNSDRTLADLQREHHLPGGRTLVFHLPDQKAHVGFSIEDGKAREIPVPKNPSGEVVLTLNTLLSLVQGQDARGRPFDFKTAWAHDYVRITGPRTGAWLSDAVLFGQLSDVVFKKVRPLVSS